MFFGLLKKEFSAKREEGAKKEGDDFTKEKEKRRARGEKKKGFREIFL